jgi:hypothetical protein
VLRRFRGRRGRPELKRKTRRTHWWGCGHKTGVREGRTAGEGSGRVGAIPVRNSDHGEGQFDYDRARLEPAEVGKYYGSTPGHRTGLG